MAAHTSVSARPALSGGVNWCVLFSSVLLAALMGCGKARAPAAPKENFTGRQLVIEGKYKEAIPELEAYLRDNPKGKFASRSGLFLGKAHLALGQMDEAEKAFADTAAKHPGTLEAHKCRYKLALVAFFRGDLHNALKRFDELANRPDGPLAPEAKAMGDYLREKGVKPDGN